MITEWLSPAEAWRKDKASGKLTSSLRFGPRLKLVKLWRVVNSMKHKGLFGCPVFSSASSQISLDFCGEADRDVELSLSRLVWSQFTNMLSALPFHSLIQCAMHLVQKETNSSRAYMFKALWTSGELL